MADCPNCGAPMKDGSKMCIYCGHKIKSDNELVSSKPKTSYNTKNTNYNIVGSLGNSNSTIWLRILDACANITIALGIICAVVIGIILITEEELIWIGILTMILGSLVAVISSAGIKALIGVAKDIHVLRRKFE